MSAGATKIGLGIAGAGALAGFAWSSAEGRASAEWAWSFFLRVVENGPIGLWAVLLAILAGWLVTLRVAMIPMTFLSATAGSLVAQMSGTGASFAVVWLLWREPLGLIVGSLVGLAAPYTWSLMLIILELCPGEWARRWAAELRGEGKSLFGADSE